MNSVKFDEVNNWQLINTATGEVKPPEEIAEFVATPSQTEPKSKRSNFAILYPLEFYGLVNAVGSKKMAVIKYIIQHMSGDNVLIATAKEIAEAAKVGKATVDRTLQALEDARLITRRPGVIMVNPKLINRKHKQGEYKLLIKYSNMEGEHGREDTSPKNTPPQSER